MKQSIAIPFLKRLAILTLLISPIILLAQDQRGMNIPGENAGDQSGTSVSMPDINTIAIGAPINNGAAGQSGHARVYQWDGSNWIQKGQDLNGQNIIDRAGASVCMPTSNTIAIGGTGNGRVWIYEWYNATWNLKGSRINSSNINDEFGYSLDMPTTTTIGVGAPNTSQRFSNAGLARVYFFQSQIWRRKGIDFQGDSADDFFGQAIAMGNIHTVAIGAPQGNNSSINKPGYVKIYAWNGTRWNQKGSTLVGESSGDRFGSSLSMPDENTLAVGAPLNSGGGSLNGHVRVFRWNGNAWIQKGGDIDGTDFGGRLGSSVSMSDSNLLAVSAPIADGDTTQSGVVKMYYWNGNNWIQKGASISGDMSFDRSGESISMVDGTVGIGSRYADDAGLLSGHARVYDSCSIQLDTGLIFNLPPALTSLQSGALYQWLDCNNGYVEIPGETNQSYFPSSNGSYAVRISLGNCVDTSACYLVNSVSLFELNASSKLKVYPNPFKDQLQVQLNTSEKINVLEIKNLLGEIIYREEGINSPIFELNFDASNGLYFLELVDSKGEKYIQKIIKK